MAAKPNGLSPGNNGNGISRHEWHMLCENVSNISATQAAARLEMVTGFSEVHRRIDELAREGTPHESALVATVRAQQNEIQRNMERIDHNSKCPDRMMRRLYMLLSIGVALFTLLSIGSAYVNYRLAQGAVWKLPKITATVKP